MKRLLVLISVLAFTTGFGQSSNSWVDHSKTYYKFTVGKDSLYRISYATLNSAGLGNTPSEHFQLWRNGEEQPLYITKPTGTLGTSDFIEFWGRMNDGKMDKKLYRSPDYQLSDKYSIHSDTAAYYLTVNATTSNLRFRDVANNTQGTTLTPEPYFMNTRGHYFKNRLNPGYGLPAGTVLIYSSSYDIGEGWASFDVFPIRPLSILLTGLNIYNGGPAGTLKFAMAGTAFNSRNIQVKYNNTYIYEQPLPYFGYVKKTIENIPQSLNVHTDYVRFYFESTSNIQTDRSIVSNFEFTYPSRWNFNNQNEFSFEMPASPTEKLLEIQNFQTGGEAPVLLDRTSLKRYQGDVSSVPGKIRFVLPASGVTQKYQLLNVSNSVGSQVPKLEKKTFVNFAETANQGDYLIISNKALFNSTGGKNNVDLYKQYRESPAGGNYNVKVIDIDELVDQFAYGIKKHPSSIKDFIQFAASNFTIKPKFVFLIGKGVSYDEYLSKQDKSYADKLNLVPTFGYPASDVLLVSSYGSAEPTVPVGRLSAVTGDEVGSYLNKMKEYESKQKSQEQTLENKLWMKNVIQIVGGSNESESGNFKYFMDNYRSVLEDTLYGANVDLFLKTSNSSVQLISGQKIEQYFKDGISLISYFGHSSANTLGFNLSSPNAYDNPGKYPFFMVSGCTAGNNYIMDSLRLHGQNLSISEDFVLTPDRGSIAFFASTHYGLPPQLHDYNMSYFKDVVRESYGLTVGEHQKNTIRKVGGNNPNQDFFTRADFEEMTLHGDPALRINSHQKPDYILEDKLIKINPSFISVSESHFVVDAKAYNIGKAISDSITFQVKRTYPDGTTETILNKRIKGINYVDSISIRVPVISTRDKGLNKITVTIDSDNDVAELSESNNTITKEVYIFEDEARPAYPGDFAIVNVPNQKLFASTADPFSLTKAYVMEIDTTQLFNSAFKRTREINSTGGVLEFDPGITYQDNTVYYWRVAVKPTTGLPEDYHWNRSSFIYLANSSLGANQSHYYQQLASDTQNIQLTASRKWEFSKLMNLIEIRNAVWASGAKSNGDVTIEINGSDFTRGFCAYSRIAFSVIDPVSLKPWLNNNVGVPGKYGSQPTCQAVTQATFQFNIMDQNQRKAAMNFLKDSIPDNFLVVTRMMAGRTVPENTYAENWMADTTAFGSGNSLYHALKSEGFYSIDSFNRPRAFIFMYQKNNSEFNPVMEFSEGIYDKLHLTTPYLSNDTVGYITSPKFGPSVKWKEMHWRGTSLETDSEDEPTVQIIGVDYNGNEKLLFNVDKSWQDVDISSVNAEEYPFIQLKMINLDRVNVSPYQLSYWRLNYESPPEGALTPNLFFQSKDTLEQGETLNFGVAFRNISIPSFDSLKVRLSVIDEHNVTHTLPVNRQKPLISGDTILFKFPINTKTFTGDNTIHVDFNPDNDQPEEYHYNNFLYKKFYVKPDNFNPVLDVTFDGVHILNRDIVSARPHILIKLKDESKFMALSDTALFKVQIRYPDGSLRSFSFDNDTMRFTPPDLSRGDNTATIDFSPQLFGDDDEYELIVSGKDVVGNKAGELDYHVKFRVISKPMISNLLNYPNPFTTSTAFVFTVTGSVVPQNIRIQILTVTGKVVREITKEELGPLHIGRNITEYKWDGTDMFGQKLANGVYLYRVLTNLDGKSLDKYTADGDKTDKYFTKGYGKMYLMR